MHKYWKQKASCEGTDAQVISGSIHTRHLVCMFDVAVQIWYMKVYEVQSLELRRRWRTGCRRSSASRADEASSREYALQKTWSSAHPCKCTSAHGDFGGMLSHSLYARRKWDGDVLFAMRLRDCASVTPGFRGTKTRARTITRCDGTKSHTYDESWHRIECHIFTT
jgi:hypothetical protein